MTDWSGLNDSCAPAPTNALLNHLNSGDLHLINLPTTSYLSKNEEWLNGSILDSNDQWSRIQNTFESIHLSPSLSSPLASTNGYHKSQKNGIKNFHSQNSADSGHFDWKKDYLNETFQKQHQQQLRSSTRNDFEELNKIFDKVKQPLILQEGNIFYNNKISTFPYWQNEFYHNHNHYQHFYPNQSKLSTSASVPSQKTWTEEFEKQETLTFDNSYWNHLWTAYSNMANPEMTSSPLMKEEDYERIWNDISQNDKIYSNIIQNDNISIYSSDYLFEIENPYLAHPNPYWEGFARLEQGENLTDLALLFEAAIQRGQEVENAWYYLASIQAENEKEVSAIAAYRECLRCNPSHSQALLGLAISYTNEGLESQVLNLLACWIDTQYPALSTSSIKDLQNPHITLSQKRQIVADQYLKVVRHSANQVDGNHKRLLTDPDVQVGLGILFYNAGEFNKSIDCFTAALKSRSQDYSLWNRLGATLANSHRSEEAIPMYEQALKIRPSFIRARHNLGVSCMNIGCYKEAAEHLFEALSTHNPFAKNISTNLWECLKRAIHALGLQEALVYCDLKDLSNIKTALNL